MLLSLLFACLINKDLYEERKLALSDQDGDGFRPEDGDCDDLDPTAFPGADERCDERDEDCDGAVDEDPVDAPTWYLDADEDGFGDTASAVEACAAPAAHVATGEDCLDSDADVHPDSDEICNDGWDNDCDGTDNDCTRSGEWSTDEADAFVYGSAEGDGIGLSLVSADLDGDGHSDILTGALHGNAAHVVRGRDLATVSFLAATGGSLNRGSGLSDSTILAQGVGACDLNGDGWTDALVSGLDWGVRSDLWVFEGPLTTDRSTDAAWARIASPGGSDFLGNSMACGDVDGDTVVDLLVGAGLSNDGAGAAWWIPGGFTAGGEIELEAIGHEVPGDTADMHLGAYLALADVDGDGVVDRIIGATEGSVGAEGGGTVYIFTDRGEASDLGDADVVIVGTEVGGRAGVVAAGDLDGDGRAEVGVGAPDVDLGAVDGGAAFVYSWTGAVEGTIDHSDAWWTVIGEQPRDYMGMGISITNDINGDGSNELVVGAVYADLLAADGGAAHVLDRLDPGGGSRRGSDVEFKILATNEGAGIGFSSDGRGDINSDGLPDLLVAAFGDDTSGTNSGAVFVFFGRGL